MEKVIVSNHCFVAFAPYSTRLCSLFNNDINIILYKRYKYDDINIIFIFLYNINIVFSCTCALFPQRGSTLVRFFRVLRFFRVRFLPYAVKKSALFSHALIYICAFFLCDFFLCVFFSAFFSGHRARYCSSPHPLLCSKEYSPTKFI